MFSAVVFDMYETLVTVFDRRPYYSEMMAEDAGVPVEQYREHWHHYENIRTVGGCDLAEAVRGTLKELGISREDLTDLIVRKRLADQDRVFGSIRPEIIAMLEGLKQQGFLIGLISNCYLEERDCIRASRLAPYFDVMMLSCELGIRKPDPEIFSRCAEALNIRADEILYVGDGGSMELEQAAASGMVPLQACWFIREAGPHTHGCRKEDCPHAEAPEQVLSAALRGTGNLNETLM